MYDETIVEVPVEEYERMKETLSELNDLLEQLVSAYESASIDLVEEGEIDLDEALESASKVYHGN